jgi:hypothetical protein
MHERFSDPVKAACYVGAGLPPNVTYSVTYRSGERARSQLCGSKEVVRTIEIFCRRFPRTSVLFYPEPVHGLVAVLHCHCDDGCKLNCCDHGETRPSVFVRLAEAAEDLADNLAIQSVKRIAV